MPVHSTLYSIGNSVLVDDLGASDLGFKDPRLSTPFIDTLRADGIELSQYYAVRLFRIKNSFRTLLLILDPIPLVAVEVLQSK